MHTNIKVKNENSKLFKLFKDSTNWNKARIKCMILLIQAMIKLQSVSYVKLAQGFETNTSYESNLRRIQRFFANFCFDPIVFSKQVYTLLPSEPPYRFSMDRTNWKFGTTDINILMICVCYKGVAIPLIWKLLPKKGNSNMDERCELMNEFIQCFGVECIQAFMADREFIGEKWFDDLIQQKISFYIRIKNNMRVRKHGQESMKAFWLFRSLKCGTFLHCDKLYYLGKNLVYLSGCKTINAATGKIEYVITRVRF